MASLLWRSCRHNPVFILSYQFFFQKETEEIKFNKYFSKQFCIFDLIFVNQNVSFCLSDTEKLQKLVG